MAFDGSALVDLITTTQNQLGRLKWTNLTLPLQEYVAMDKLMKKENIKFDSGKGIQFNVKVSKNPAVVAGATGNARNKGMWDADVKKTSDYMQIASIPWRHSDTHYLFNRLEVAQNREPSRIVDMVKTKRVSAMEDLVELMEANFWGSPADSDDSTTPYGVGYWIVENASEGFNGGAPSGFTTVAGLNPSTYTTWKNYTAQYTNVATDDLIRKWRKALHYTKFKAPVAHPDYNRGNRYGQYTNYDVYYVLEEALRAQNDNLGDDLAKFDGSVQMRRIPVEAVPYLDNDASDPVYGINWGVFSPVFLSGEYMVESKPKESDDQHLVLYVYIDLTYNFICYDRRRNFLINKA